MSNSYVLMRFLEAWYLVLPSDRESAKRAFCLDAQKRFAFKRLSKSESESIKKTQICCVHASEMIEFFVLSVVLKETCCI